MTSTASGTISASADWSPSSTTGTWSGSVGALGQTDQGLVASAGGPLTATVSWPSTFPEPVVGVQLIDPATGSSVADSGATLSGTSASFSYTVPSSVGSTSAKAYTLRVYSDSSATGYTLSSTYPVTANLGLEIWSGSTRVASSSGAAKPQSVTASGQPAGVYTIKVLSHDYAAGYTMTATYPVLAYADLTVALSDAQGHALGSARSSSGSAGFSTSVPSAAAYSVAITNNSPDIAVASFSLDTLLPKSHPAAAMLSLQDAQGHTLATATGSSPLWNTQTVVAGVYDLVLNAVTGTVSTMLGGSYPGRAPREVIGYDGNDHAVSIDDGTTTTKETLSPSACRSQRFVVGDAAEQVVGDDPMRHPPRGVVATKRLAWRTFWCYLGSAGPRSLVGGAG